MNFAGVLKLLENYDNFPIVPKVIEDIVKKHTDIEEIVYIGVNVNAEILRGGYIRVLYENIEPDHLLAPYAIADTGLKAKIYYSTNQDDCWIRLVINKELLHILDPDKLRLCTPEELTSLVNHLRVPREILFATVDSESPDVRERALVDYLSDYRALAAMVPEHMRLALLDKYKAGKVNEDQISKFLGIPIDYASILMTDMWPKFRTALVNL